MWNVVSDGICNSRYNIASEMPCGRERKAPPLNGLCKTILCSNFFYSHFFIPTIEKDTMALQGQVIQLSSTFDREGRWDLNIWFANRSLTIRGDKCATARRIIDSEDYYNLCTCTPVLVLFSNSPPLLHVSSVSLSGLQLSSVLSSHFSTTSSVPQAHILC